MSGDTGKEQQVAALCGGQVSELGGTDCNCSLLFYWRLKIWFQLACEIGRSVLPVSVKFGPSLNELISTFKWFIPVVCDYHIKYQNDIRWVSQNTTLYYGVRCQKVDNMFRPFSIRPSSDLTW